MSAHTHAQIGHSRVPEWLRTVVREAAVRPGLVLYGNVRDLCHDAGRGEYVPVAQRVARALGAAPAPDSGFTIVGRWDRVDGLRFGDTDSERRFHDALRRSAGGATQTPADGSDEYDLGFDDPPTGSGTADGPSGRAPLADPGELLPALRQVLADGRERPLIVLEWSHLLVTQPAHPDPNERAWLLQLSKLLAEGAGTRLDSDALRRGHGVVVLLADELGGLPPALYQGEPRVRLISVPLPCHRERAEFFDRHLDDLRIAQPKPLPGRTLGSRALGAPRAQSVQALADRSDDLGVVDLRQVVRLSHQTPTPLPPEHLLNLYRFGEQRSPWEDLDVEKLGSVDEVLRRRVKGQDAAVEHVGTMVKRAWLGLAGLQHSSRRSKPKGTLFFVGPTGVGKTELAKSLAEFLFGDESACVRFDMSEYNHEHSDQRLVGAPPGYVGFENGGQLTNAVRERPFCVLLFDEIEKAHGRVLDKFLQILEDGRLTDGRGETTYFSECVIIFTSNIGAANMPPKQRGSGVRHHFLGAVEEHFVRQLGRPELLNRLGDNIVVFEPIVDGEIRNAILERKIEPLRVHLAERFGLGFELTPPVQAHLLERGRVDHGGRGLLNTLERDIINPLSRYLFDHLTQVRAGRRVTVVVDAGELSFELREAP